ncbi:hypothetical protein FNW02_16055 [Komarekiella sp. 'clone 1']|uniref:Uncharacterized protein n=1 Tax=Komarekiella delphini-convector SJRDD-AB1 TaxID=2593771 RepID=A0AA40SXV4_9NOST|nr:hypothetical protein [Komarekiella delphini-convector]MBD6617299.1 hypothetical protein [Komarekiella delphini-convector SJRDD-AB1]
MYGNKPLYLYVANISALLSIPNWDSSFSNKLAIALFKRTAEAQRTQRIKRAIAQISSKSDKVTIWG